MSSERFAPVSSDAADVQPTESKRRSTQSANRQCRAFLSQGHCRFGNRCRYSHQVTEKTQAERKVSNADLRESPSIGALEISTSAGVNYGLEQPSRKKSATISNGPTPRPLSTIPRMQRAHFKHPVASSSEPQVAASLIRNNRAGIQHPCREWSSTGKCSNDKQCLYKHDPKVQDLIRLRNEVTASARAEAKLQELQEKARVAEVEAARQSARRIEFEAARQVQLAEQEAQRVEIAKADAAVTSQHIMHDFMIITFGAGLAVEGILTGFEACQIKAKNLPLDATYGEVRALFTQQGIEQSQFLVIGMNKTPNMKQEALIVCHEDLNHLAIGLDGIEFREATIEFEICQNNNIGAMYPITIPIRQYHAQKKTWDSLLQSVRGNGGCQLWINARNRVCIIRVAGEDRKAIGSLKVRAENIAAGEKLERWHRSIGFGPAGQRFLDSVFENTGAFARSDRRLRQLKVYGEADKISAARAMIDLEVERLEALEQTVFLKRQSVAFFVRKGLAEMKEVLGDDNVTLNIGSPCTIVIRGGEEARYTLSRLIDESLEGRTITEGSTHGTNDCPICYDEISSPVSLGCGHSYCTTCIRHFITTASDTKKFPLSCMGAEDTCGVPIPIPMIQKFLPLQQFELLVETVFIAYVEGNPQDYKYCTTPDCRQVYRCNVSSTPTAVHCPACFASVCSSCHGEMHEGMTCDERRIHGDPAEQDRLNDQLAMQSGFKKCPQCNVWIEKNSGCNHMECHCGAHICWVCMGVFPRATIYEHMGAVHGGIDGEANPVNQFNEQRVLLAAANLRMDQLRQQELQRDQNEAHEARARIHREINLRRERLEERLRLDRAQRAEQIAAEEQARRCMWDNQLNQQRLRIGDENARIVREREERLRRWQNFDHVQENQQEARGSKWGCVIM